MNLDRKIIDAAVLFAVVWFMRRDVTLGLAVAVTAYVLRMLNF